MADLTVELVRDTAALEDLRPAWLALWRGVPGASPFRSPDWLVPWWQHVGEGALLTPVVRRGGALVGVVPLYVYARPGSGERALFPLGIGTTDHLDAVVAVGEAAAVMRAALAALDGARDAWDAAEWPQLLDGAALLAGCGPAGWLDAVEAAEPCPAVVLHGPPEAPGSVVPAAMRRDLRNWRARAARAGAVRFERASAATLDALFDAQLALHRARWEGRGEPGVLADRRVEAAHRAALPGLLRDDVLRLYAMRLDGAIVGTLYGFIDRPGGAVRRFHAYLGGFDPAWPRLSPGSLLIAHAMEEAVAEGATLFDFLRGGEAYKYAWGAVDVPTWCRRLRPAA